ncbi:thioredoxin 1 [Marinobacter daqiaonensis]|uniref:Thioredoxin 1 n=1 Tax=Marinobacter daqiaonensis TaxID=650891 RepID=A0A1I6GY47_9GAMM|nr:thioredoxin family protein [Marinobacter daqiaonensis]SFR47122.1 thioredoxin 1 [Marinobacter daqiaonensis]
MTQAYSPDAPDRDEIDRMSGPVVVEFGTDWCGHCQAAQPLIADAFDDHHSVTRLKIEDGKGRRLGRSFGVKLWPTLIFLRDGEEVSRLVRPRDSAEIKRALNGIDRHGQED